MTLDPNTTRIAVIGGSGKEGKGLATRWSQAGFHVIIGSRSAERAASVAQELNTKAKHPGLVTGASNEEAAAKATVVVLTVPYAAHSETVNAIKPHMGGKPIIDASVPLVVGQVTKATMPAAGSAALETRQVLGASAEVAGAFHNISHEVLMGNAASECDVLVTGTSKETRAMALELVHATGLRGWDAGPLENSAVSEGLTSVLIHINKKYGSLHAGIRITGTNGS